MELRYYINDNKTCLMHSNCRSMENFEYINIDSNFIGKFNVLQPTEIISDILSKTGLNYHARPFTPSNFM